MGKKRKHDDKADNKDGEETVGQQIKSIGDLFASSCTDPALEALFKKNVLTLSTVAER